MKTVYINGRFLTQRMSGVQRFAFEVLKALDRLVASDDALAFRYVVVAPRGTSEPPLSRIHFERVGPLSGHAWEQLTLPVVVGNDWLVSFGPTGPALKRNQLVTIHDAAVSAVPDAYSYSFRAWYRTLLPILVERTPATMTVSEFSRSEISKHFGADARRLHVCSEGWQHVLEAEAEPSFLAAQGLTPQGYLLAVSSIAKHKNFEIIVRSLDQLPPPRPVVVVAGAVDTNVFQRSSRDSYRSLKRVGYVSDGQLRTLYENATAFIFPSLYEGFGIPPLEAMALDCPVIAAAAAAIPEVCGEAACYFSPGEPRELAAAIERLTRDPAERERLVSKGRERSKSFSWESSARSYLDLLSRLIAPGAREAI